jgi:hypothetical protein
LHFRTAAKSRTIFLTVQDVEQINDIVNREVVFQVLENCGSAMRMPQLPKHPWPNTLRNVSIVITVATPYGVVQVSDMQVTAFSDGTIVLDRQRKSLVLRGEKIVALLGWVGLATIAGHNTGAWLHGQLDALRAVELPLDTFATILADSATLHFATLPRTDKRCTFAIGGVFVTPVNTIEPFFCSISNCEDRGTGRLSAHATVRFEPRFLLVSSRPERRSRHPFMISVDGDEETAAELPLYWRGLRGLLKQRADMARIGRACLQIARAVATRQEEKAGNNSSYVRTVGKNFLLVGLDRASGALASAFFPEDGSVSQTLAADVVTSDLSARDVTVERRVNAQGHTEIKVKGLFKVDRLPADGEPPLPLLTFSPEWIGIGGAGQAEGGAQKKVAESQAGVG